jgi:hypothetical protein
VVLGVPRPLAVPGATYTVDFGVKRPERTRDDHPARHALDPSRGPVLGVPS